MYTKVYKSYREEIFRFVYSRIHSREIATDIASKVFVKLFTKFRTIRHETVRAWLYQVARNEMIDYFRARKQTVSLEEEFFEDVSSGDDAAGKVEKEIQSDKLKKIMGKLLPKSREIVTLRVYEELSFKEISDVMNITEGSAKMMYYRAIDKLSELLNGGKADI